MTDSAPLAVTRGLQGFGVLSPRQVSWTSIATNIRCPDGFLKLIGLCERPHGGILIAFGVARLDDNLIGESADP